MYSSFIATCVILTVMTLIVASLICGLIYLLLGTPHNKGTVLSLTIRISLSMSLFAGLILTIYHGWITPNPPPLGVNTYTTQ